ncbi:MAG: response regulator transcription factor [Chloroflexi bacterium]|nr:response regulator transcription factor [Chloroflexota bacterium]
MTTVVLVDDHPIVRAGLRAVLSATGDISVVAEGTRGADALHWVAEQHPDVLILDVNLPDLDGIEVTRRLRAQGTRTAILILTVHDDQETVFGVLESGATGYVLKDDALETVAGAVRAVARGETWLSPGVATLVVQRATGPAPAPAQTASLPLTAREIEVLGLLAQGLDNAAIAQRLVLATRTVQNHVSTIYSKLGVTSRTQAALLAIRHGLAHVPPAGKSSDAS